MSAMLLACMIVGGALLGATAVVSGGSPWLAVILTWIGIGLGAAVCIEGGWD